MEKTEKIRSEQELQLEVEELEERIAPGLVGVAPHPNNGVTGGGNGLTGVNAPGQLPHN